MNQSIDRYLPEEMRENKRAVKGIVKRQLAKLLIRLHSERIGNLSEFMVQQRVKLKHAQKKHNCYKNLKTLKCKYLAAV